MTTSKPCGCRLFAYDIEPTAKWHCPHESSQPQEATETVWEVRRAWDVLSRIFGIGEGDLRRIVSEVAKTRGTQEAS